MVEMKRLRLSRVLLKNMAPLLISVVAILSFSQQAMAFTWTEVDDAGEVPLTAQATAGDEPLELITGFLESPTDVDMYAIFITDESSFSATTVGWTTGVDTQLTLFDSSGMGVYSNDDDVSTDGVQSTLPAFHPLTPTTPGFYYLAISDWDWDPVSEGGYIFPSHYPFFHLRTDVEGPTDDGGGSPIIGWDGLSTMGGGSYTIALTGATFSAPAPKPAIMPWLPLLLLDN